MKKVSTVIPSVRNNIQKIEKLLYSVNKEFKLKESEFHKVLVAVSELVLNAIVHGNKELPEKKVKVSIGYGKKTMTIKISDEGNGFDIDSSPDPTLPENIMKNAGRGIFIVKSLMENIKYKHTSTGSEVILTVVKK